MPCQGAPVPLGSGHELLDREERCGLLEGLELARQRGDTHDGAAHEPGEGQAGVAHPRVPGHVLEQKGPLPCDDHAPLCRQLRVGPLLLALQPCGKGTIPGEGGFPRRLDEGWALDQLPEDALAEGFREPPSLVEGVAEQEGLAHEVGR